MTDGPLPIEAPTGEYETALVEQGFELVAGADEAGRGALAGPLVAAAVILPPGWVPDGLNDSKLVAPTVRERLHDEILENAVSVGVYRVTHRRLDSVGLQRANLAALRGALNKLEPSPEFVLVDGFRLKRLPVPGLRVVKGDQVCTSVAAASIIAKVTRDRIMTRAHRRYPGYGFASNKGYRAPEHLEGLRRLGPCDLHRRCFAPVAAATVGELDVSTWDPREAEDPGVVATLEAGYLGVLEVLAEEPAGIPEPRKDDVMSDSSSGSGSRLIMSDSSSGSGSRRS